MRGTFNLGAEYSNGGFLSKNLIDFGWFSYISL